MTDDAKDALRFIAQAAADNVGPNLSAADLRTVLGHIRLAAEHALEPERLAEAERKHAQATARAIATLQHGRPTL